MAQGRDIHRRDFLKYTSIAAGAAITGLSPLRAFAADQFGRRFTQRVNRTRLYMTHYATFEEPDPIVPAAIYFDQYGQPTNELTLAAPVYQRTFTRSANPTVLTAPTESSPMLPYFVDPPGFPTVANPPDVVNFLALVAGGLPFDLVNANTHILLVAIGQFLADGTTTGRMRGENLDIVKTMHFQVRIRIGYLFTPPGGQGPAFGMLVSYLDMGTLSQLAGLPPPIDPTQTVVYDWRAPMTLSTANQFIRQVADEPPPVADPFPDGLTQLSFVGSVIDSAGNYTVVGHATPAQTQFLAPPALVHFLFGVDQLTDIDFVVEESGVLLPL